MMKISTTQIQNGPCQAMPPHVVKKEKDSNLEVRGLQRSHCYVSPQIFLKNLNRLTLSFANSAHFCFGGNY